MGTYPEMIVRLDDGNLVAPPEPKVGDSVLVLGTSTDGPVLEPARLTDEYGMQAMFGSQTAAPCNLSRGLSQVVRSTRDVVAMKLSGKHSETILMDLGDYPDGTVLLGPEKLSITASNGNANTFVFTAPLTGFGSADNDLLGYLIALRNPTGTFIAYRIVTSYTVAAPNATIGFANLGTLGTVVATWTAVVAGTEIAEADFDTTKQLDNDYYADVIITQVTTDTTPTATTLVENEYNYDTDGTLSNAATADYALNRRTGVIVFNPCFDITGTKLVITGWRYPYTIILQSLFAGTRYNGTVRSAVGAARSNENATYQIEPVFDDTNAQTGKKLTITNPTGKVGLPIIVTWPTGASYGSIVNAINTFPQSWLFASLADGLETTDTDDGNLTLRPTTDTSTLADITGFQPWADLTPTPDTSETYLTNSFGYYVADAWDDQSKLLKFRFADNEDYVFANVPTENGIFEKCLANRTVDFTGGDPTTTYTITIDYNETAIVYADPWNFTTDASGEATVTITHAASFIPARITLTAVSGAGDVITATYTTYEDVSSWHTTRSLKYDLYNVLSPATESTADLGLIPKGSGERGAYDLILDLEVEHAVAMNMYFDDELYPPQPESASVRSSTINFASQGARMAYRSVSRGFPRHFYNSFKPPTLTTNFSADVETWVSYCVTTAVAGDFDIYDSNFGSYADAGKFLALIVGPQLIVDGTTVTPEAVYAGMVARLDTWSAPTYKVVPAQGLRFKFYDDQLRTLVAANLTTFSFNRDNSVICKAADVYAAPISSNQQSDYVRLATGREIFAIVKGIRVISERYIGEPINRANMNAMYTAIGAFLDFRKKIGAINGSDFRIESSTRDQITGTYRIKLIVVPALEAREIRLSISLEAPAPLSV